MNKFICCIVFCVCCMPCSVVNAQENTIVERINPLIKSIALQNTDFTIAVHNVKQKEIFDALVSAYLKSRDKPNASKENHYYQHFTLENGHRISVTYGVYGSSLEAMEAILYRLSNIAIASSVMYAPERIGLDSGNAAFWHEKKTKNYCQIDCMIFQRENVSVIINLHDTQDEVHEKDPGVCAKLAKIIAGRIDAYHLELIKNQKEADDKTANLGVPQSE